MTTYLFELWSYDIASGPGDRVAAGFGVGYPVWAPDGTLAYSFRETSADAVHTMLLPSNGDTPVAIAGIEMDPLAFVGRQPLVGSTRVDVTLASLDGNRVARADTLKLPNAQYYPVVSPDGRWIAYAGAERGGIQLFVTPFRRWDGNTRCPSIRRQSPCGCPTEVLYIETGYVGSGSARARVRRHHLRRPHHCSATRKLSIHRVPRMHRCPTVASCTSALSRRSRPATCESCAAGRRHSRVALATTRNRDDWRI